MKCSNRLVLAQSFPINNVDFRLPFPLRIPLEYRMLTIGNNTVFILEIWQETRS